MTRRPLLQILCTIFLAVTFFQPASAEVITDNDYKFSLDIPEGYKVEDYTEDGMSYIFTHPNIPVTLVLKIYQENEPSTAPKVLQKALTKLSAKSEIDKVEWSESISAVSSFNMLLDKAYTGWAVCSPLQIKNAFVALLCYSPTEKFDICQQFIMSTINSLCINDDFYNCPGIITTYAFPSEGVKNISATIAGKKISSLIDNVDQEAANFVVDLEYAVLTLYTNHKLWKEAWQRYYKMIYRDSYSRILKFSGQAFNTLYPLAEKANPQNPDIAYAQYLLSWVQTFEYQRAENKNYSDFTSIPAVLCGQGNDCDSRSMLVSIMLNAIGIDTIILFSPEYSHAMVAANITAPGQTYTLESNQKEYIFGETTAKVTWGMIAQSQTDRSKWIPVKFCKD